MTNNLFISINQTNKLFNSDYTYSQATFSPIIYKNSFSPTGGNSISSSELLSLKKAISETEERHATIMPTIHSQVKYPAFDIISGNIDTLSGESLGYDTVHDSTGTATHTNAFKAISHAIGELIEKNALLQIWYKGKAKNISKIGWQPPKFFIDHTYFLYNDFFTPYHVVLSVYEDKNHYFHCGLGFSNKNINLAKKAAFEEMRLIWFQNNIDKMNPSINNFISEYWQWSNTQKRHLKEIISKSSLSTYLPASLNITSLSELGKELSISLRHLYIVYLPDTIFSRNLITIRCYSNELVQCVATKDNLLKILTNNKLKFITKQNVKNIVDCPIV